MSAAKLEMLVWLLERAIESTWHDGGAVEQLASARNWALAQLSGGPHE